MHMLQHRLASVRRRWRFLVTVRGVSAMTAVVVGSAALIGLADWWLLLPSLVRAYGLVAILAGAGYVAFRWLVVPYCKRCDDLSLAIRIEDAYPELNDALASTVQFIEDESVPGSPSMRTKAIDRALDATSDLDFGRILDRRGFLWSGLAMLAALAVAGHFAWNYPDLTETALLRLTEPFGQHTWTRISLEDVPTRIAVGQPFPLHGQVEGIVPTQVRFEIEGKNPADGKYEKRSEKIVALKIDAAAHVGKILTALDVTQHKGNFRFRALGNDGRFPANKEWHEVEVVPPPAFVDLNGRPSPQITLFPPEYTDLPSPQPLSPGTRHLEFVQGTTVVFQAAVDRPLSAAWIELRPLDPQLRVTPLLGLLGQSQALDAASLVAVQQALAGRYPAALDATGQVLRVAFQPWVTGSYVLRIIDADGLVKDYEADLRINLDPLPVVQIQRPGASQSLLPDATVFFKLTAEDDFFAVRSVYLEYRRKDADGAATDAPRKIMLYNPSVAGWHAARFLHSPVPMPMPTPPMRLRPKRLELAKTWALARQFKEGDVILIQGCADDFCNIIVPRQPGRSPEIELRIVSKSDLAKLLDEGLGQAQQELVRIQKMQQDAIDLVKQIDKAKEPQQKLDRLVEAEQIQKQIQERIGNRPDEGLREQLGKLEQLIKDNKLPSTENNDQVKELLQELNRLSQEDMQKIEQSINEARKDLAGTQKPMPPDSKKQAPLDKTKQLQQQAKDAIDQMTRKLDQWADVNLLKQQIRDLIQKEKQIAKETEAARQQAIENQKKPDAKKQQEIKDALKGQADAQSAIADNADGLQKTMEKVLGKKDKGNEEFKDLANKLKKTQRIEDDKERADALKQLAKEARAAAENQNDEAKATLQELAKEMEAAANQMAKGKMSDDAQMDFQKQAQKKIKQAENEATPQQIKNLKDAVKIGQDADVPQQLKKANDAIDKQMNQKDLKNLDEARKKQEQAIKDLQKQLAALEGQNDDGLDRLRKKQRDLAKAEENLDKLDKNAKNAQNIKNADEKAEELRNLAKEARDQARELQRLQEEKASKDLKRAAQMLEDAADKMQRGEQQDAEGLEREANDQIQDAKKKLEEFEEELAREQLAKIADRLKGLKERQDTAIERSKELHQNVLKGRDWSPPFRQTLDGNKKVQEGLAEETRELQEKIKEAKVFEHIMDKAAKSMDQAADAMAKRKEQAGDRKKPWSDDEMKDEERRQDQIVKLQTQAAQRLQRLLDALKEEPQVAQQPMEQQPMEGGGDEQPRMKPPGDGIPPLAELKALRAEQLEVNERTKEFAQRHPNVDNLNEEQRRELRELEEEQGRLRQIFGGMTTEKKGDRP